ncbi:MAG TPA: APC family permease [Ornithinimicrobium sp.]|uniref:APC family permease n=1 Tax=Ornithinimicrobium sp. TaxID=1977084 RepID=UPI002B49AE8A|nr:APC family permease [Ornithinimicrobium sp.]HKJ13053.1 APC family permease [Ornithinimicrobium sp.]
MSLGRRLLTRMFVGRALRTDRLNETLLPKRLGMPVFASDALSSVAYAPDEIVLTLALAGGAAVLFHSWEVTLAVALVMLIIVASYRQNVHAYPSGGGDYEVASVNLGSTAGLGVGAALMVDYVLTVAVSVSAGVQNAASALEFLRGYEPAAAVALIVGLTLINLRGVRESGRALAVPVYAFLAAMALMIGVGMTQWALGSLSKAASSQLELRPAEGFETLTALGLAVLLLRAFASGTVALTGVQGVANGVPAFQRPKSKNAATVLLVMATLSITILLSVITLTRETGIQMALDPQEQIRSEGRPVGEDFVQDPVLGQLSKVIFGGDSLGVLLVSICTGVMLIVAANTAFNGFPVLASRLARDDFLPSQLLSRGVRLAYSNGILLLAAGATVLVLVFQATVTQLIQMYLVGVFVSFTLSQLGMIRHWNTQMRLELGMKQRRAMLRSRAINIVGAVVSATVLVVVILTRFTQGAGLALLFIALIWMVMTMVDRFHSAMRAETALPEDETPRPAVPARVHALVYVEKVDRPTLQAVTWARAARPQVLEAVLVDTVPERTAAIRQEWDRRDIPIGLRLLEAPYREQVRPVMDYVGRLHRDRPRDLVVVYLAEYIAKNPILPFVRDRARDHLRSELVKCPGVMVVTVPWQGKGVRPEHGDLTVYSEQSAVSPRSAKR